MSTRRSSVGVGVLNSLLYAVSTYFTTRCCHNRSLKIIHVNRFIVCVQKVGGYDGVSRQCLSTVEFYNPETNAWSKTADMTSKRSGAGVGVMDGILYAVGGHDGPAVRNTVEAFDPVTGVWKQIADMSHSRRNAGKIHI